MLMKLMTTVLSFILTMAFAAVIAAGVSGIMNWFRSPEPSAANNEESM